MDIIFTTGDIFESSAKCLVNPVNTKGVSGKGLALAFKNNFPNSYIAYRTTCLEDKFHIGDILVFEENDKIIYFFPTKDHWKYPSKLEYIEKGLNTLINVFINSRYDSLAIPPLGCGLGGLDYLTVRDLIIDTFKSNIDALKPFDINKTVYLYNFS